MTRRLAAAIAFLFLAGALVATFAPTGAIGSSCGTWVAPEYDRDEVAALIEKGNETSADLESLGADGSELAAMGDRLAAVTIACEDSLDTRRLIALVLLGLAVAAPAAVMFVGNGRKTAV